MAGLPEAEREAALVNTKIEVDVHWPDSGLVVEVDGVGHERASAQGEDERRDRASRAAGWEVKRLQSRAG